MGSFRIEQRGRVLVATFDNPPHALMDASTIGQLSELVARVEGDEGVGAVVLTGAHPDRFIAHYDVQELLDGARGGPSVGRRGARASVRAVGALRRVPRVASLLARTPVAGLETVERFHSVLLRMNRCGAVFVCALNGSAQGGGCEIALACDFRLMASRDGVGIGQPEILFGFPPGGGGTQRLTRLLGTARALRLVLDGGPLTPAEALELGVVDEVVPEDELLSRAVELAGRLGSRPKAGVAGAKRAVYDGGSLPLADGLRVERAEFVAAIGTPAAEEAMAAYVDGLAARGELPAYDGDAMEKTLREGRFSR